MISPESKNNLKNNFSSDGKGGPKKPNINNSIDNTVNKSVDGAGEINNKVRSFVLDINSKHHLISEDFHWWPEYKDSSNNVGRPRGISKEGEKILNNKNRGIFQGSLVNKVHIMRLVNGLKASDIDLSEKVTSFAQTFTDLCSKSNIQYDPDDFLYCKNLGVPINRLITLRRFPYGVTDNIYDKFNQAHPDVGRMVTFFTDQTNKLEDIISFSFGLRWKELTATFEAHQTQGDSAGINGFAKKVMQYIDPVLAKNSLMGENQLNFEPTYDQNKVYGPVDSLDSTHIRDVGFNFDKEFDISFEYELRSYAGRTPEYAMRDIIANVLAVTYNNGKFWGGARFWVGERPTQYLKTFQGILNPKSVNEFMDNAWTGLKSVVAQFSGGEAGSKIAALKNAMSNVFKNALAVGLGKMLDQVGRASIITSNSLLSGEPIGNWHLTVGHPENPILCIGNLMCTNVDIKFPSDELSYGMFPTHLQVNVRLKPAMAKDRAGIEIMFNMGRERIYQNPKKIKISKTNSEQQDFSKRTERVYNSDVDNEMIFQTFNESMDLTPLEKNGKEVVNKGVELVIDGNNFASTHKEADYNSMLSQAGFAEDNKKLNDIIAAQQQSNSYNTSGIGSGNLTNDTTNYTGLGTGPLVDRDNIRGTDTKFNPQKAAQYATDNAASGAKSKCQTYTRVAVENGYAGGKAESPFNYKTGQPEYAKDAGKYYKKQGWAELPLDTKPKIGDVCVLQHPDPKKAGHTAIWNGRQWVSDFKQKGLNVWNSVPPSQIKGAIYRS